MVTNNKMLASRAYFDCKNYIFVFKTSAQHLDSRFYFFVGCFPHRDNRFQFSLAVTCIRIAIFSRKLNQKTAISFYNELFLLKSHKN